MCCVARHRSCGEASCARRPRCSRTRGTHHHRDCPTAARPRRQEGAQLVKLVGRVPLAALSEGAFVRLEYPPFDVLVALVDGAPFAIEDACNHSGASLCEGPRTEAGNVVCPMHGYVFSLRTGALVAPLGLCDDQRTFDAHIEGTDVVVY